MKHIHSNNHPGVLDERGAPLTFVCRQGGRGNMAPLASGSGKLATHDDVVDGSRFIEVYGGKKSTQLLWHLDTDIRAQLAGEGFTTCCVECTHFST